MQLFSKTPEIPFMSFRIWALVFSCGLILFSFFEWFQRGDDKFGVDFLGGTEVVLRFPPGIDAAEIRKELTEHGVVGAVVQSFDADENDFAVRLKADASQEAGKNIQAAFSDIENVEVRKVDFVGPIIGAEIRKQGAFALLAALVGILIYVSLRFEFRFAVGAIIALVHDVIVSTGVYVLSGREISAAVLAGLLTIIGYSLNDTIIVFDRVRENLLGSMKKRRKKTDADEKAASGDLAPLINMSVNQTLSRTLLTSLTTLFVVTTLWLLGGGAVADLAFTLVIGVVVGTYSSIFIASPALLLWKKEFSVGKEEK